MSKADNRHCFAGISIGDPNGVGMEVILKSLADDRLLEIMTPVVFVSARMTKYWLKELELTEPSVFVAKAFDQFKPGVINLFPAWQEEFNIQPGTMDAAAGALAMQSLQVACDALEQGAIDFLVTAPLDKSLVAKTHDGFTGHTGFLGQRFEGQPLMILCSEDLRVALVTGHVPLAEVSKKLSIELIMQRMAQLNKSLKNDFGIQKPRIAVLGLNPHNGDDGLMGSEEKEVIRPAVERAFGQEILAFGPYSPDGFFGSHAYREFDAVLAMYHDQGLIPFKMLGFEKGVNFTAGLSIVRTSPDHGTAFDIAGQNKADESSFREALYMGREVVLNRRIQEDISANPLAFGKRSARDS
jgi:4-hydroxythreonine-4-phosphate dehydrogenase